jgi:hypothetical protein
MEFLRLGSSIPGSYWGTCSADIIQFFKVDPDAKASIQLVSGDGGGPLGDKFAGPTYRDIFWQRYVIGTFGGSEMPNHAFFAVLTTWQISGAFGQKWLAILKEAGFEFIRSWNNSVGSPKHIVAKPEVAGSSNDSHLFALFRNIGGKSMKDQFTPPSAWTELDSVKTEAWQRGELSNEDLTTKQFEEDKAIYERVGPPTFLTEAQVVEAGAPVIYAARRSRYPQQPKEQREALLATDKNEVKQEANPFNIAVAPSPQAG